MQGDDLARRYRAIAHRESGRCQCRPTSGAANRAGNCRGSRTSGAAIVQRQVKIVGGVGRYRIRYHDLAVAVPDDEYVNKIFNGELEVCIGAAENAVYVSMGTTPKTHLQKMIGASKAAPAKKIMPLQFVVKMLPLLKFAQSMEDNPAVAAMIDGLESGNDHVRVNVMPISSGFTYRFELEEGVLELLGKAAVSGQQAAAAGF